MRKKDKRKTYLTGYLINPQGRYTPTYGTIEPAVPVVPLDAKGVELPPSGNPAFRRKQETALENSLKIFGGQKT